MPNIRARLDRLVRIGGISLVLIAVAGSAAWFGTSSARQAAPAKAATTEEHGADTLKRTGSDGLTVPTEVASRMSLHTATAKLPTEPRTLPSFSGQLAVDNNLLSRVYSRFPGEVVSLGTCPNTIPTRSLRVNDKVTKGQTLAVVSSTTLGEKKSELVDALSKLRRDEDVLASLTDPSILNSIPPRSILDAKRDVESDRVAVARAERTLISWRLSDDELKAIRTEAADLAKPGAKRPDPATWSLSAIVAPRDGIIIQKDTSTSAIVDTTSALFYVADLSQLAVWANVYEEDLPLLQLLPRPIHWKVNIPSRPGASFGGTLDSIASVIQPDQHTALISGTVANPDGSLFSGMFVTVSIDLPPPRGEIEIPAEALIEDGRDSVVFVRGSSDHTAIVRNHVKVARRFRDVVYLSPGPVHAGDEVITSGSLLLNEAMNELPAPRP